MKKPYVLWSPPYDVTSGGIKVMFGFYGWLLSKGQPAFLNQQVVDVPSIAIYPEIVNGNPLGAAKCIRYILQKPSMMGSPDEFGIFRAGPTTEEYKTNPLYKDDEIYVFSRVYDEWGVPDDHILFLPIIDLHTFKNLKRKRDKVAFYVGKGVNLGKHPKEAVELHRSLAQDQQALAEFLNECEVLYVYDRMSAAMECSRLCGTRVVYWGDMPRKQFELYEPGMNGISYKDEVERELHAPVFRASYRELIYEFSLNLDKFIVHTQS